VDPELLGSWRVSSRAAFQKRSVQELLVDVERAREVLRLARIRAEEYPAQHPRLGGTVVAYLLPGALGVKCGAHSNLPSNKAPACPHSVECWGDVPELPEASVREGIPFLAIPRPGPDKRRKVVLQSAPPEAIEAFLRGEGIAADLTDKYGDPARGFAGGYI